MRSDMPKVIVERPRVIHFGGKRGRPPRDLEDLPSFEGMRRPHDHYGSKVLRDHLAPLLRYLEKQVGRPWNKIYSDVCQNLRAGNVVQDHVREHVRGLVAIDGPAAIHDWQGKFQPFYVDPRTGMLSRKKRQNVR
jgi:hypothetical protein